MFGFYLIILILTISLIVTSTRFDELGSSLDLHGNTFPKNDAFLDSMNIWDIRLMDKKSINSTVMCITNEK